MVKEATLPTVVAREAPLAGEGIAVGCVSVGPTFHHEVLPMTTVRLLKGDATSPQARGVKIIAHICNDLGNWGKGFVLAISARWPEPEKAYQQWHRSRAEND